MSDHAESSLLPASEPRPEPEPQAVTSPEDTLYERSRRALLRPQKADFNGLWYVLLFVFFVFSQQKQFTSPLGLALMIGVLLFHEGGHALGMLLFGFRDLRMFFIPFFGAAVSGRGRGVAAWKEATVSLLGPVPGIGLGIVAFIVFVVHPRAWIANAAELLLYINLFNLLPFGSLDGGRFLRRVLFSRHRMLDVVFQALGSLVLAAWAVSASLLVLAAFAVFGLAALPTRYRVLSLAAKFRSGLPTSDPSALSEAELEPIYHASRAALPAAVQNDPTRIATMMDSVLEATKPAPGILASLALLTVYGFTLIVGVVFVSLLSTQNQPSQWRVLEQKGWQAEFPAPPDESIESVSTPVGPGTRHDYDTAIRGAQRFSLRVTVAPADVDADGWLSQTTAELAHDAGLPITREARGEAGPGTAQLELGSSDRVLSARLFVVGRTLYQLTASAPERTADQRRFIDSFALEPEPK